MDWSFLPVLLLALLVATVFTLETNKHSRNEELHIRAATYNSNRRAIPEQILQNNATASNDKGYRSTYPRRATHNFGSRINVSPSKNAASIADPDDEKINEETLQRPTSEEDGMTMAGAGRRKNSKSKRGDDDDDDEKTLSQQIADGKYGLIEKEIYATTPKRPGIVNYASNPEVPRDTAKNLGGLDPEEIWLAENHVLVLRGGFFPEHKFNRTDDTATAWPPIDSFNAPPRQVKIPANPKVPPPFPVQLTDDGPTQFIGFNGTAGPSFPPFFPQPPPGNGSYFAPPFPFPLPPPGNFTPGFYPPIPPGNFTPGGGFYPPPGNGSFYPPPFPFPLPPPRNGSYFIPPPGNFTPGSGPFYPPPFPGFPLPPPNATFTRLPPPGTFPPPNGTLPFPPHFFQNLPPGAAFLPPPGNLTEPFDEDDPSLYYPPPYDFYYPQDNSTEVPPGPLVPGIVLPPPPNFFAPLNNRSDEQTKQHPKPPIKTHEPPSRVSPHRTYLPANRQQVAKGRRPSISYLPVTTDIRKKKPHPTITNLDNDAVNHITQEPEIYVLTTPEPQKQHVVEYTEKYPRPPINIAPQNVQVTHQGSSRVEPSPPKRYYYDEPAYVITRPPETIYINNGYSKVITDVVSTPVPGVSFYSAPITDIVVQPTPKNQETSSPSKTNNSNSPSKEIHDSNISKEPKNQRNGNSKQVDTHTTTLAPLLIFYTPKQQDVESNTPKPEPYYVKAQGGLTATIPPVAYYTAPSAGKPNDPASVKTSFYFYEEPQDGYIRNFPITTQAPPSTFQKPIKASPGYQYSNDASPASPVRGRGEMRKMTPQHTLSESDKGVPQSEAPPTEEPIKTVTQTVRPQKYSTSGKFSTRPQQYIYSDALPINQVKSARQRTQTQPILLSSILPAGQQVVFSSRPKIPYASTPAPPQYYYVTVSPGLQYNIPSSNINQQYSSQLSQQGYAKPTPQPSPIISNLAYFTTPRPDVYQDLSQRPILYNIPPSSSSRPIYQYSFESNQNSATQEPLRKNVYTTPRPKGRPAQDINYQTNSERPILLPVQYQTTPRTLFEYSYEQQGLSTAAPQVQGYYSAVGAQYDEPEDVTAGSPTTHYGYDSREQNHQSPSYQSTPKPKYNGYQNPPAHPINIYSTANPLHSYFTRQDETLLDDITKKYFTIFGQKLQAGEETGPTTPIPPHTNGNLQRSKQTNTVNRGSHDYTTPTAQKYNFQTDGSRNGGPISLADDINVNYKKPLPSINPYSELIDTRQVTSSNSDTGRALVSYRFPGDGGHFYFITPQVVGAQQSQQTANGYLYSVPEQPHHLGVTYRRKKRKDQR